MDLNAIEDLLLTNEGRVMVGKKVGGSRYLYDFDTKSSETILHGMYWLPKKYLDVDLEIIPKINSLAPSCAIKKFNVGIPHPKNTDWIGIPKFLGLSLCGEPHIDKRTNGTEIHIEWNSDIKLRPEQILGLEKTKVILEKWGGAFWIADCGFGKTKCIARLIYEIGRKTCVVVPQTILIEQMCAEFGSGESRVPSVKARVAILQGSWEKQSDEKKQLLQDADIVVASLDSLSLFRYPPEFFDLFGLFIFDEAHHMAARTLCKVMNYIPSRYIVGFSATPDRSDGLSYLLHWILGPTSYVFQRLPLVTGKTHTVHVRPIECPFKIEEKVLWNGTPRLAEMMNDLVSTERNTFIYDTVLQLNRKKILCITAFRDHAEQLYALFLAKEPMTALLHGGLTKKQKKPLTNIKILVATYGVLQEGFDDAELDTLVMCTPRSTIQQVVGRIERTMEGKLIPLVIDFIDQYTIFQSMYRKRSLFYKSRGFLIETNLEPKFDINQMCVEMSN